MSIDLDREYKFLPHVEEVLRISLSAAVPFWVADLKDRPWSELHERAERCGQSIAEKSDVMMYGGKQGQAGDAFNRLAEALAIGSFVPGGIKFLGLHFENQHAESVHTRTCRTCKKQVPLPGRRR